MLLCFYGNGGFQVASAIPVIVKITTQCVKRPREATANKCRKSLNQRDTEIRDGNNLLDHLVHSLRP